MNKIPCRRVVIDLEQAYDIWSLLFCAIKNEIFNSKNINIKNTDYSLIMNKSLAVSLQNIKKEYSLDDT